MQNRNKKYIQINIVGKIFTTKSFNIKYDVKIEIVKELILARLKIDGNSISPTLDQCWLITSDNKILNNNKTVYELCNERLIYDGCNLSIDIKVQTNGGVFLSYNSLLDDKLEFGKSDIESNKVVSACRYNPALNIYEYFTEKVNSKPDLSVHHKLAWDNTPINDSDWY
jgi:hypothetical protein